MSLINTGILLIRRTSHWFEDYKNEYEALFYALQLLEMEKKIGKTIKGESAFELVESYTKEYFNMDQFYRKFYLYYDRIDNKEPLFLLAERVENTYTNWYLNELSVKWSAAVEEELIEDYPLAGIRQQKDFYRNHVLPFVRNDERVFVIVSDALRYEAGEELISLINKEIRGIAEIGFMQGVVPSTTKFGMACLRPRKVIAVSEKGEVLVDGINTQGTENRGKILKNYSKDALINRL